MIASSQRGILLVPEDVPARTEGAVTLVRGRLRQYVAVACFLIVGAAINIGLAWACVLWWPGDRGSRFSRPGDPLPSYIASHIPAGWHVLEQRADSNTVLNTVRRGFGMEGHDVFFDHPSDGQLLVIRAGWPARAFSGSISERWRSGAMNWNGARPAPQCLRPNADTRLYGTPQAMPIRPLWSGMVTNTFFFAAVSWGLVRGPRTFRRRFRAVRPDLPPLRHWRAGMVSTHAKSGASLALLGGFPAVFGDLRQWGRWGLHPWQKPPGKREGFNTSLHL